MKKIEVHALQLKDGSKVAVIGGGPTGAFFSIFALKMAKMIDLDLSVTIFDSKDFSKDGPAGCNHCGGIISELLVQTLAIEGISLPDSVVRRGIHSYRLHTSEGVVSITTPHYERTIATVSRGGGPRGLSGMDKKSFDRFLMDQALGEGAMHKAIRIDRIGLKRDKSLLFSQGNELADFDLVVGAFGVNSTAAKMTEALDFGYQEPKVVTAAVCELVMDADILAERFGHAIHLFLLPDKDLKFAALIPKGPYVTLCILGKELSSDQVAGFLENPIVRRVLPDPGKFSIQCRCLPKMNVSAPKIPFTDRFVMCGDAGSTRLFKDGLGAAYLMGKAAAKTAIFDGVGREHFQANYLPVYKSIVHDNFFGRMLYLVIDLFRQRPFLTRAMLDVVHREQVDESRKQKTLSTILWDMFTGNERYKTVFTRSLNPSMHGDLLAGMVKTLGRSWS
jgi:flavin-dependent dehydrogenase